MKTLAILLMIVGFVFGVAETIYFGCNWLPHSNAEIMCDLVSATMILGGYWLINKEIDDD